MEFQENTAPNEVATHSDEEDSGLSAEDEAKKKQLWSKIDELLDTYFVNQFQRMALHKFIKVKVSDDSSDDCTRARDWLFMRLNGVKLPKEYHKRQLGCPDLVPGITIKPWWEREEFPWVAELESHFEEIRDELMSLRNSTGFQPYRGPSWAGKIKSEDEIGSKSNDNGDWNVFYLFLHNMKFEENWEKAPKTVEIIRKIVPRQYCHAFFSALTPGAHVLDHNGPTNRKLRLHLPLVGVEGSKMRVGDETRYPKEGEWIIFDDSFNHEAWHEGDTTRIILILDLWHPDLSDPEVKFFSLLQKSKLKGEKYYSEKMENEDNLFSIVEKTKGLIKENDSWWIS